ncbi:hypothetical protein ACE6H2_021524 [Prunus campanulata]
MGESRHGSTWLPMCGSLRVTHNMGSHVRGSVETNCVPHRKEGRRKSTLNRITPL